MRNADPTLSRYGTDRIQEAIEDCQASGRSRSTAQSLFALLMRNADPTLSRYGTDRIQAAIEDCQYRNAVASGRSR